MCQDGTNAKEAMDKVPPMQEVGRVGMGILGAVPTLPPVVLVEQVRGGYIVSHGGYREVAGDTLGMLDAVRRQFGL